MSHFARAPDAASLGTVGIKVDVVRGLAVKVSHAKIIDVHGRTLANNDIVKFIDDTLTLDAQPLQFEALASLQGPLKLEIREPGIPFPVSRFPFSKTGIRLALISAASSARET